MSSKRDATAAGGGEELTTVEKSEGGTTVALQRKKSRRVSFAENTCVHIFDRDEEYNEALAAEESAAAKIAESECEELNMLLEFHSRENSKCVNGEDMKGGDDDTDDDDDDFSGLPSFLKPLGSPSPGSTIGSATSNDEDNYFGPVSASFIRPGRHFDSATSDDNHEVTLDSTSFSMHFRSLARSDSGADLRTPTGVPLSSIANSDRGDLKTPTAVHLSFEQKSPSNDNVGSSMDFTMLKKPISLSSSGNVNCDSGSSDMSLIVDNFSKYNYGRLPPEMETLLIENAKGLPAVSSSLTGVPSPSSMGLESKYLMSKANGSGLMDIMYNRNEVSSFHKKLGEETIVSTFSPKSFLSTTSNAFPSENLVDNSDSLPGPSSRVETLLPVYILSTADNIQPDSPALDLINSSTAKGREAINSSDSPAKLTCFTTPVLDCSAGKGKQIPEMGSPGMYASIVTPQEKTVSLFPSKIVMHDESASSIQKSISKLNFIAASSLSSYADNRALDILKPSPISRFSLEGKNDFRNGLLETSVSGFKGRLLSDPKDKQEKLCPSQQDNYEVEVPLGGGYTIAKGNDYHLRSKGPTAAKMVPLATNLLLTEVCHEHVREKKAIGTPLNFSPLDEVLKAKKVSPENNGPCLDNYLLRNRLKNLQNFFTGHGSDSKGAVIDVSISTVGVDDSGSKSLGSRLEPGEPDVLNNSNLTDHTSDVDFNSHQLGTVQNRENYQTPNQKLNDNFQTGMEHSLFGSDHPGGESDAAASIHRKLKEVTIRKNLLGSFTQRPPKNDPQVISSKSLGMSGVENDQSPVHKFNSLDRKRTKKQAVEGKHGNEAAVSTRSPKIQKIIDDDVAGLCHHNKDDHGTIVVGHELQHWTDIYPKFLKEAENVFCSSIDKLNVSSIELLEDYLVCLRRSKSYGVISNKVMDQKRAPGDVIQYERVCEARRLLHQLIHEMGKLQLVRAKRQKLLDKLQQLNFGIEESQKLKVDSLSKCIPHPEADTVNYQNLLRSKHRIEVTGDKVTAMKQALEVLDRKASNLMKTLTIAHKIKAKPSCDIIESINDHLIKKLFCRNILFDSKIWVVNEVKSRGGYYNIILNYLGFINQSFNVTFAPASDMVISNELDDKMISERFPRLDACTAFSFVLNAETTRKYFSSKSLAQETLATSAVLGNLVDVVQEIQQARLELQIITRTAFHCPSVTQLDLHICYFNFKNGKKAMLTLDLSCLKRGIYPSEILPSQLATGNAGSDSSAEPMIGEIMDGMRNLRAGYMRILRLCRLVSQVVQTSKA